MTPKPTDLPLKTKKKDEFPTSAPSPLARMAVKEDQEHQVLERLVNSHIKEPLNCAIGDSINGNHGSERVEDGGSDGGFVGGSDGDVADSDDSGGGDEGDIFKGDDIEKDHVGNKGDFDGDDKMSLGFLAPQQSRIDQNNASSNQTQGMAQKRKLDLITDEDHSYGIDQGREELGSKGYRGRKAIGYHHRSKRLKKKIRGTNKEGFEGGVIDNPQRSQPQKRRCPLCPKAITKAYTFKEFQQHKLLHSSNISCPSCAETFASLRQCEAHNCQDPVSKEAPEYRQDDLEKEPQEHDQQLQRQDEKQQDKQELETDQIDDYWGLNLALLRAQMQADRDMGIYMKRRKCRLCPSGSLVDYSRNAYLKHVRRAHQRALICPQCAKGCESPSALKRHMKHCVLNQDASPLV